jgi:hypothetical protein
MTDPLDLMAEFNETLSDEDGDSWYTTSRSAGNWYFDKFRTWYLFRPAPANRPESHPSPPSGREEDEIDTITNNPNVLEALERSGGAGTLEGRVEAMIERLGDLLPEPPEPGVDGLAKSIETLVRRYEEEFREVNRLRDILNAMQEKEAQAAPPDSPVPATRPMKLKAEYYNQRPLEPGRNTVLNVYRGPLHILQLFGNQDEWEEIAFRINSFEGGAGPREGGGG